MTTKFNSLLLTFCLGALLSSCTGENKTETTDTDSTAASGMAADSSAGMASMDSSTAMMAAPAGKTAEASISSASGSGLTGMATFTEENGAVKLVLTVEKATPGPPCSTLASEWRL